MNLGIDSLPAFPYNWRNEKNVSPEIYVDCYIFVFVFDYTVWVSLIMII